MIENWLKPVPATFSKKAATLPNDRLGAQLVINGAQMPDLKKVKVALIGVGDKSANAVREYLYSMTAITGNGTVADLGNLRKPEPTHLIQLVRELVMGKIVVVIIGEEHSWGKHQFLAFQEMKQLANLVLIDETYRQELYEGLIKPRHNTLFHVGAIGFQAHQTSSQWMDYFQKSNYDLLRLGRAKSDLEETEPIIRDADAVVFHLNALKQMEMPGVEDPSPSGFNIEEACQMCRYAGMSDKLNTFGLYGFIHTNDIHLQSAKAVAQMTWYFAEGVLKRKNDYPVSTSGMTEYVVAFRKLNMQLVFWKSDKSGRWWLQAPSYEKKRHERHRLIPCSLQDYQAACRDEMPERLFQALKRF